jgi:hypothetical protein
MLPPPLAAKEYYSLGRKNDALVLKAKPELTLACLALSTAGRFYR